MTDSHAASSALEALGQVTAALPAAEDRPGQRQMTELVATSIEHGRHLVVQAGTGTGKTLAYLVPAITSGKRTIVATATKALQDQLATKDLPFLAAELATHGHDFDWAVLKGRSNYVCLQRLREMSQPSTGQLELEELSATNQLEIKKIAEWAGSSETGDQSELTWSPSDAAWRSVSVGSDECPGGDRCPMGQECFAETARRRAQASDVIVVNTYLYGLHVGSGGAILPEHDVVVFDEAHVLEDTMSDTVGIDVSPGRFVTVSATIRRFLDDPQLVGSIVDLSGLLREAFAPYAGTRLTTPLPSDIVEALDEARLRLTRVGEAIENIATEVDDAKQRKLRAQKMIARSMEAVEAALTTGDDKVPFISGSPQFPRLEIAPLDVGPVLTSNVWSEHTAILTSATIPRRSLRASGCPTTSPTPPTSGARSTMRAKRCSTAPCTCRSRALRSTETRSPRS